MRRLLIVAVVVSAVLGNMGISGIEKAEAHKGPAVVSSTAGNGLNLRSGPGAQFRVLLTMHPGDALTMRGHRGNWLYATHLASGLTGWAWLAYTVPVSGTSRSGGGSSAGGLPRCYPNSWGQVFCASEDEATAAWSAAVHWGASYWWLMSIASCESNFSQFAYNGATGVSGILQFLPSTFYAFGGSNLWSYWEQFYVAARMYVLGYAWMWDCNWRI